ncbi:hypothetical protein OVY01_21220 [Robbsia sp. Bb-Pol-6]|uniref:AB hydrolase-1 domain-containing protein n=1 Tax=Robbsia betulipollinis TaxID=2981849 RepID=A0ABT3ZSY8_9BURK|nr:hypothetical protein [Robbsia betulipollinis]MCY0389671.1 hypothetical protein [Robbsia betulipollinis]
MTLVPAAAPRARNEYPVRAIGPERLRIATPHGDAVAPFYRSTARGDVTRIVIVLHGRLRDADAYLASAQRALDAAGPCADGTLLLVPQFLASADIAAHGLTADVLHWEWTAWMGGDDARGPTSLSSFDVLDALLARCLEPGRHPALREIVVAGHSGGAQVAHRYAIVGRAAAACRAQGLAVRYVIANPSSYVYFDAFRPFPAGRGGDACPGVDDWKYGVRRPPRYAARADFTVLARAYAQSDVTYLLGGNDDDPAHQALDRSCAAAAQGPHRLARGRAYVAYLRRLFPGNRHVCREIPGVGHDGDAMLGSAPGILALFGVTVEADRLAALGTVSTGAGD